MKKNPPKENSFAADEIAEMYNQHGRKYHESRTSKGRLFNEYLEMPATLNLLPKDLNNIIILDAGCGSGIYAKKLAAMGAEIIGVDISQTMIDIANEEKTANEKITYQVGNLEDLNWIKNTAIDLIVCNYVLENIKDIKPIFSEFYRILKKNGICIFSISHPIRAMANKLIQNNQEIWQLENYYDNSIRVSDFGEGLKIKKYKRTISEYVSTIIECGFTITDFCEPQPIAEGKQADPNAYELAMRLPQLLVIKLTKN